MLNRPFFAHVQDVSVRVVLDFQNLLCFESGLGQGGLDIILALAQDGPSLGHDIVMDIVLAILPFWLCVNVFYYYGTVIRKGCKAGSQQFLLLLPEWHVVQDIDQRNDVRFWNIRTLYVCTNKTEVRHTAVFFLRNRDPFAVLFRPHFCALILMQQSWQRRRKIGRAHV